MKSQIPMTVEDHLVNPESIKLAFAALAMQPSGGGRRGLQKAAFIPGGDPSMMGGGGGGAPPPPSGGDPSGGMGGGGMPPGMDPSMMMGGGGGADPSAGMGAPPPPPGGGGGGGGGGDSGAITAKLDQLIQIMQGGGVGGQSGQNAAGQIKPKIDVNVAIMQLSKMVARIADALGVKIPASEMIATPNDLTGMAQKQMSGGQEDASMAPGGAPGGGGGGMPGGIQPMDGMPNMAAGPGAKAGADRHDSGTAYAHNGLEGTANKAAHWLRLLKVQSAAA